MNHRDPKLTSLLFNECINDRNIEGLVELMTDDHTLICDGRVDTNDEDSSRAAWLTFFDMYPDYRNHFSRIESSDDFVVVVGKSACSNEKRLNGNALWSVRVRNDKVCEWQVYADTLENRERLRIR